MHIRHLIFVLWIAFFRILESKAIFIDWSFLTVMTIGDKKNWSEQFNSFSICPSFNNFSSSIFNFGWKWIGTYLPFWCVTRYFLWNFELTVWCFDFPIREISSGNLLPVIFLLHSLFLCFWFLYLGKVSVNLLFPIDQTGPVQGGVEIRLLLPWFCFMNFPVITTNWRF